MAPLTPPKVTEKVKGITESISRVVITNTKGTAVTKAAVHRRKQSNVVGSPQSPGNSNEPTTETPAPREDGIDIYGFEVSLTPEQMETTQKCVAAEERQRTKWSQYSRETGLPPEDRLKKLCRRGIPQELRKWVWMEVSGANERRTTQSPTYYVSLAQKGKNTSPMAHQIRLDVPRTFPTNAWLQSDAGQAAVSRVLYAFSLHNPLVGYCQGLNFVVAILLLVLGHDEEAAFWVLASLIDEDKGILYQDMYSTDLSGTHVEMRSLMELVESKVPRLAAHMETLHCDMSILATDWFLCLFSTSLPSETTARVWDAMFNEGPKILFRVALALLKLHEPALLAADNPGELLQTIRRCVAEEYDRDELMQVAFEGVGSLPMNRIQRYRAHNQRQIDTEFAERRTRNNLRKAMEEGFVVDEVDAVLLSEESSETAASVERTPSRLGSINRKLKEQLSNLSSGKGSIKEDKADDNTNGTTGDDDDATSVEKSSTPAKKTSASIAKIKNQLSSLKGSKSKDGESTATENGETATPSDKAESSKKSSVSSTIKGQFSNLSEKYKGALKRGSKKPATPQEEKNVTAHAVDTTNTTADDE